VNLWMSFRTLLMHRTWLVWDYHAMIWYVLCSWDSTVTHTHTHTTIANRIGLDL
jgi:hypothetical protein